MAPRTAALVAAGVLAGTFVPCALAQPSDTHFRLQLEATSKFTFHHCTGPCDCIPFDEGGPLTGAFNLHLVDSGPLFDTYAVSAVYFVAAISGRDVLSTGAGSYQIGGEFALVHRMKLRLDIRDHAVRDLDSGWDPPPSHFPLIDISLSTSDFSCTQVEIDLHARPTCPADFNGDGFVDGIDYDLFNRFFERGDPAADWNGDTFIDGIDYDQFMNEFESPSVC